MTILKISFVNPKCTGIIEYCNDVPINRIIVRAKYEGGDIREFIESHPHYFSSHYKQMEILFPVDY